jgi:hypothetical protein
VLSLQSAALESLTLWPSPNRTPSASIREATSSGCSDSTMWSSGRLMQQAQPKGRHALMWRRDACAHACIGLLPY